MYRQKIRHVSQGLLSIMFLFIIFLWCGISASASEDQVAIVLHDVAVPESQLTTQATNNSQKRKLLQEYQGVNGAEFSVYDVSERFYQKRALGTTVTDAQQQLAAEGSQQQLAVQTGKTAVVNEESGVVVFHLPRKHNQTQAAVYLFVETAVGEGNKQAANLVAVLDNESDETIQLYLKNKAQIPDLPELSKTILNEEPSYQIGAMIEYQLQTTVPGNLSSAAMFVLEDTAGAALDYIPNSLQIRIDSTDVTAIAAERTESHGFQLSFDVKKLTDYKNKPVTITYQMRLNSQASAAEAIVNTAQLVVNNVPISAKKAIYTGGKQFKKTAIDNQQQGLAGAQFYITNQAGAVLIKDSDSYSWSSTQHSSQRVILQSDKDGNFSIEGLMYGDYALHEITAPDGYVLSTKPVSFTVNQTSFQRDDPAPLKVVNAASHASRYQWFPKTGERVQRLCMLLGIAWVGFVGIIVYRKRKKALK